MATSPDSRTRSATPSRPMAKPTKAILSATMRGSAASRPCSIARRAWCWCPASALATIADAEAVGRFEPLPEADLFDVEYWSLEQAKLGKAKELPLAGQVPAITGAA